MALALKLFKDLDCVWNTTAERIDRIDQQQRVVGIGFGIRTKRPKLAEPEHHSCLDHTMRVCSFGR